MDPITTILTSIGTLIVKDTYQSIKNLFANKNEQQKAQRIEEIKKQIELLVNEYDSILVDFKGKYPDSKSELEKFVNKGGKTVQQTAEKIVNAEKIAIQGNFNM